MENSFQRQEVQEVQKLNKKVGKMEWGKIKHHSTDFPARPGSFPKWATFILSRKQLLLVHSEQKCLEKTRKWEWKGRGLTYINKHLNPTCLRIRSISEALPCWEDTRKETHSAHMAHVYAGQPSLEHQWLLLYDSRKAATDATCCWATIREAGTTFCMSMDSWWCTDYVGLGRRPGWVGVGCRAGVGRPGQWQEGGWITSGKGWVQQCPMNSNPVPGPDLLSWVSANLHQL